MPKETRQKKLMSVQFEAACNKLVSVMHKTTMYNKRRIVRQYMDSIQQEKKSPSLPEFNPHKTHYRKGVEKKQREVRLTGKQTENRSLF